MLAPSHEVRGRRGRGGSSLRLQQREPERSAGYVVFVVYMYFLYMREWLAKRLAILGCSVQHRNLTSISHVHSLTKPPLSSISHQQHTRAKY
jgi:hypothetical protein